MDDVNKACFCQLVQTWLIKTLTVSETQAVHILYQAQRCIKTSIPRFLPQAVFDFIDWQMLGKSKPEWVSMPTRKVVA